MSESRSSAESTRNGSNVLPVTAAMSGRPEPECIRLGVKPGVAASGKPPVRIYLGTQPAQFRAERAFISLNDSRTGNPVIVRTEGIERKEIGVVRTAFAEAYGPKYWAPS